MHSCAYSQALPLLTLRQAEMREVGCCGVAFSLWREKGFPNDNLSKKGLTSRYTVLLSILPLDSTKAQIY